MEVKMKDLYSKSNVLYCVFIKYLDEFDSFRDKDGNKIEDTNAVINIELKIGGVSVNPENFFQDYLERTHDLIIKEAEELVSARCGSDRMNELIDSMKSIQEELSYMEQTIDWNKGNIFTK